MTPEKLSVCSFRNRLNKYTLLPIRREKKIQTRKTKVRRKYTGHMKAYIVQQYLIQSTSNWCYVINISVLNFVMLGYVTQLVRDETTSEQ